MDHMIGQRIKDRRKELNITQIQIQEATGISSGNLSGIENGRYLPSTAALLGLSQILECSIDWILKGDSLKSTNEQISDINENANETSLITYYRGMSEDDQEEIMMMAQLKYNRAQKTREREQKSSPSGSGTATDEIA